MRESNWVSFLSFVLLCLRLWYLSKGSDFWWHAILNARLFGRINWISQVSILFHDALLYYFNKTQVNNAIIWWANTNAISRTFPDNVLRYVYLYTLLFDHQIRWKWIDMNVCALTNKHTHTHTCQQFTFPFADLDNGIKCHCTII